LQDETVVVLQLARVLSRRPCASPKSLELARAQRVAGQVLREPVWALHAAVPGRLP
jgi:hypothetical protein